MTFQTENILFKNNELIDENTMTSLAQQLNAIEPSSGETEAVTSVAPQLMGTDASLFIEAIAAIAICSALTFLYFKSGNLKEYLNFSKTK